jgi:hypothetical protein
MIEITESLVWGIMVFSTVIFAAASVAIAVIPQYLKHLRKTAEAEAEAQRKADRIEAERQRIDSFTEIIHKAQLADVARDCIAGRETAWVEPAEVKPSD